MSMIAGTSSSSSRSSSSTAGIELPEQIPLYKQRTNCNAIYFSRLCKALEKADKSENAFHIVFTAELVKTIGGQSVYPLVRLLCPSLDLDRGTYDLKEKKIADIYIKLTSLTKESGDGFVLYEYPRDLGKATKTGNDVVDTDFASTVGKILAKRLDIPLSKVTIGDINKLLDDLVKVGEKEKENFIRKNVYNTLSPVEQKWLIKIILKDLKMGPKFTPNYILKNLYPGTFEAYSHNSNLQKCLEVDPTASVGDTNKLKLFDNLHFMLAEKGDCQNMNQINVVEIAMKGEPFVMDVKLDGERFIMSIEHHTNGTHVISVLTRHHNDYYEKYKPLAETVADSVSDFNVSIDGEVCGWNSIDRCITKFGTNGDIASNELDAYNKNKFNWRGEDNGCSSWLKYIVFDIVYLEGKGDLSIINQAIYKAQLDGFIFNINRPIASGDIRYLPLVVRRNVLTLILKLIDNVFEIIQHDEYVTATDASIRVSKIEAYFNRMSMNGEEGLVVKRLLTEYASVDSRSKAYWMKIKPEYGDHVDYLDVLIIGANFGTGNGFRSKGVSTFVCAVLSGNKTCTCTTSNNGKANICYCMYDTFCRVGTGYSQAQLTELRTRLGDNLIPVDAVNRNTYLDDMLRRLSAENRPYYLVPPEKSVVIEIYCAEIVTSTEYTVRYTTRFGRVRVIRYDKGYNDIMSSSDIKDKHLNPARMSAMMSLQSQTNQGKYGKSKVGNAAAGSKRSISAVAGSERVDERYRAPSNDIKIVTSIFASVKFCVLQGKTFKRRNIEYTRQDIGNMIAANGGEYSCNPCIGCICVMGESNTISVTNTLQSGLYDVIDFRYIFDCIAAETMLPMRPSYFHSMTEARARSLGNTLDVFGDSYTDEVDEDDMLQLVTGMQHRIHQLNRYQLVINKQQQQLKKQKQKPSGKGDMYIPYSQDDIRHAVKQLEEVKRVGDAFGWRGVVSTFLAHDSDAYKIMKMKQNHCWDDTTLVYIDMFDDDFGYTNAADVADNQLKRDECSDVALYSMSCRFRRKGGNVTRHFSNLVTHVVIGNENRRESINNRARFLQQQSELYSIQKTVCDVEWFDNCIANGFQTLSHSHD